MSPDLTFSRDEVAVLSLRAGMVGRLAPDGAPGAAASAAAVASLQKSGALTTDGVLAPHLRSLFDTLLAPDRALVTRTNDRDQFVYSTRAGHTARNHVNQDGLHVFRVLDSATNLAGLALADAGLAGFAAAVPVAIPDSPDDLASDTRMRTVCMVHHRRAGRAGATRALSCFISRSALWLMTPESPLRSVSLTEAVAALTALLVP